MYPLSAITLRYLTCGMLGLVLIMIAACSPHGPDKTVDRGINAHSLSSLQAGIWVDPNGCDHWIVDDGVEGYLSARLDRAGKPVCSGAAPPTSTAGDFKGGSPIPDVL